MRCHDVNRFIGLFLDSELTPETSYELAEHLQQCSSCSLKMQREKDLEDRIRALLLESSVDEEAMWDQAVRATLRRRNIRWSPQRRTTVWAGALAIAAAVVIVFLPHGRHELDLARSAAADHSRFVAEIREGNSPAGSLEMLAGIAAQTLEAAPRIPSSLPAGCRVLKVGHCTLDSAPVVYAVVDRGGEPVSLFLIDRDKLRGFPAAAARFTKEPGGFNCEVGGRAFFMSGTSHFAACGVGQVRPSELRDLVLWFLTG